MRRINLCEFNSNLMKTLGYLVIVVMAGYSLFLVLKLTTPLELQPTPPLLELNREHKQLRFIRLSNVKTLEGNLSEKAKTFLKSLVSTNDTRLVHRDGRMRTISEMIQLARKQRKAKRHHEPSRYAHVNLSKTLRARYFFFVPKSKLHCWEELKDKWNMIDLSPRTPTPLSPAHFINTTKYPYRHVVPLDEANALSLASRYALMGEEYSAVPPLPLLRILASKVQCSTFLVERGFARYIPAIYFHTNTTTSKPTIGQIARQVEAFPVVLELVNLDGYSREEGSAGTLYVGDEDTLIWTLEKRIPLHQEFMVQEYVRQSRMHLLHVAAIKGETLQSSCYSIDIGSKNFPHPAWWKSDKILWVPPQQCAPSLFTHMVRAMEFTGIGGFHFKYRRGLPQVLHFTPRVPNLMRYNATELAMFLCSLQWDGHSELSFHGCVPEQRNEKSKSPNIAYKDANSSNTFPT